jgi:acetyl esterase/lipase
MAIAMVQLIHSRALPVQVPHLNLFYPVTDTNEKSETYKIYKEGPYLSEHTMDWMIDAFLPNKEDRQNALTSPLKYASDEVLSKFPPTTVFLSAADPLIGEGEAFGRRLQKAGVETAIIKAEGQIHDYVMLEPIRTTATAKAVVELAALHLRKALA